MKKLAVYIFAIYFAVCHITATRKEYYEVPLMNATKIEFLLDISMNQEIFLHFSSNEGLILIRLLKSRSCDSDMICIRCQAVTTCEIHQLKHTGSSYNFDHDLHNINIHIEFMNEGPDMVFVNNSIGEVRISVSESYQYIRYEKEAADAIHECKIGLVEECNVNSHTFVCGIRNCSYRGTNCIGIDSHECCDPYRIENEDCVTPTMEVYLDGPTNYSEVTTDGRTYSPSVVTEIKTGTEPKAITATTVSPTPGEREREATEPKAVTTTKVPLTSGGRERETTGFTVFTPTLIMLMVFTGAAVLVFVIGCICAVMAIVTKPSNRIQPTG